MTNGAAIGYALLALKRMLPLLPKERMHEFEALMRGEMDFVTEEEAEKSYYAN